MTLSAIVHSLRYLYADAIEEITTLAVERISNLNLPLTLSWPGNVKSGTASWRKKSVSGKLSRPSNSSNNSKQPKPSNSINSNKLQQQPHRRPSSTGNHLLGPDLSEVLLVIRVIPHPSSRR